MVYELSHQMMKESFETLGEVMLRVKRETLLRNDAFKDRVDEVASTIFTPEEKRDHLIFHNQLYHLIGDPGLRVRMPDRDMAIDLGDTATFPAGGSVPVQATVPSIGSGDALVTLETVRSEIHWTLEPVAADDPDRLAHLLTNYVLANDKVVLTAEAAIVGGTLETTLALPADLPDGTYYVKVLATDAERDAVGSVVLQVLTN
jgi:hypothetical protein